MRRVTILKYAKMLLQTGRMSCSCIAIKRSLADNLNCRYPDNYDIIQEIFPKFTNEYACELGLGIKDTFIWFKNDSDRLKFLDNLIDFYKDDKTDIKKKYKHLLKSEE